MLYQTKTITLKNGKQAIFRQPSPKEDSEPMLEYLRKSSRETEFLLRSPDDEFFTPEKEEDFLNTILESPNDLMVICEIDGKIAGNCQLRFMVRCKVRHRGNIGIALLKDYWGLGIGTKMFEELVNAAKERGLYQLELSFYEGNSRARALYEKMGFSIVGVHPDAVKLNDGKFLKEYLMIKRL